MGRGDEDTSALVERAGAGDGRAAEQLLARHRDRLRRMVAVRMDPRLAARLDPSDVVQEALMEASRRLAEYCRGRPVPFYPWLRRIAWERLVEMHRQFLASQRAEHAAKLAEINAQKKLVRRVPVLSEVESWVAEAKTLPAAVTY